MADKILAVTGATGIQGGGVINVMKNTPGWKVRAITRNPESDAAKKLAAEGIEVVQASFDDEESLVKAFEGVAAVYAVTNWWEHLFTGKTQDEAGALEEEQGMKIARAAAATPSLEHYIWSTTPSGKMVSGGDITSPHMDYKAIVDARIKAELPELAAKTTYLYFGFYPQNLVWYPMLKPIEFPAGSGTYVQVIPSHPDAKILLSGNMTVTPGIWTRQVLAKGASTFGRYSNVALEKWAWKDITRVWGEVTGKRAVYVPCSAEAYTELWGVTGNELALQFQFGERYDIWEEKEGFLKAEEDLGINPEEVPGFKATIEGLKHFFKD